MDDRLQEGVGLFNDGRFFESHEVWESLYLETDAKHKPFLEGMVQLAAALRLYSDFGEIRGPVRMIYQALIRFEAYQPVHLGVKVEELSSAMEAWAKELESNGGAEPKPIPKISLRRFRFF